MYVVWEWEVIVFSLQSVYILISLETHTQICLCVQLIAFSTSDNHLSLQIFFFTNYPYHSFIFHSLSNSIPLLYPGFQVSYPVPLSPSNCLLEIIQLTSPIYMNLFFPFDYFLIARAYQVTKRWINALGP